MGYTSLSAADLRARAEYRQATGAFGYTGTMNNTPYDLRTCHPSLDPRWRNAGGEQIRECRDSATHPLTLPIAVLFDETGSMGEAPRILQRKLATLMGALLRAGLLDAQLAFGAYGDAQNGEVAPCQMGQFESGLEMETWLDSIYLEANGGGNGGETSGLALYFLARHTRHDAFDKRGQRGRIILIGDERPHRLVTRAEIAKYIGDQIPRDLTIEEVVEEVSRLYDVYFFHYNSLEAQVQKSLKVWQQLLGEDHVVPLESLGTISEQITMLIAYLEGITDTIDGAASLLLAEGADASAVRAAGQAMVRFNGNRPPTARTSGLLPRTPAQPEDDIDLL